MYKYLQSTPNYPSHSTFKKTGSAPHKEKVTLLTYLVSHSHNNPSLNYTILQSERDTNILTNQKTHTSRPGCRMKSESGKQSQEVVKKIIKKRGGGEVSPK